MDHRTNENCLVSEQKVLFDQSWKLQNTEPLSLSGSQLLGHMIHSIQFYSFNREIHLLSLKNGF